MADNPHDRLFRVAFSHLEDVVAWLREVLPPALVGAIDWEDARLAPGDHPDEGGGGASRGDLRLWARLRGTSIPVVLVIEHQRRHEQRMPIRVLAYSLVEHRVWIRQQPPGAVAPAVIAVVVFQGPARWTASTDLGASVGLPEALQELVGPYLPSQRYVLLDLAADPTLAERGPASIRLAARLLRHPGPRGRAALIGSLREDLAEAVRARGQVFIEALLRYALDVELDSESDALTAAFDLEGGAMRTAAQELERRWVARGVEQGLEQGLERGLEQGLERGLEQGREQGLERGLDRGRAEGQLLGLRRAVLRVGGARFGPPPAEVVTTLEALDVPALEALLERLFLAEGWAALTDDGATQR